MNIEKPLPPTDQQELIYNSLLAIQNRKNQLRQQIQQDDAEIRVLWKGLFKKPDTSTTGLRMSSLMSTGAGVLDGLILGWKLYRKYKGFKKK